MLLNKLKLFALHSETPIADESKSNVIAFQVRHKNWDKNNSKPILVPSRKNDVNFKKKNMFYITIP